jgi:hypothetical protein
MNTRFLRSMLTIALNFLREQGQESCTRLCALLCCLTGCGAAVATLRFAFTNPRAAATVAALVGITSALIAAGCVALLTRKRNTDADPDTDTDTCTETENGGAA